MDINKEDIEKLAEKYAEEQNECFTNDYFGFINGFNAALELLKESEDSVSKCDPPLRDTNTYIENGELKRPNTTTTIKL